MTLTTTQKSWRLLPHEPDVAQRLGRGLAAVGVRVSPLIAQLLAQRGMTDVFTARRFIEAPLSGLHAPELLPGAEAAAARLLAAVRQKRKICVYGDYDVDGVTGITILWKLLRKLGGTAEFYVPHRLDEGYGLNVDALQQLAAGGVSLVITVDCGITSVAEAAEARRLGMELIVTDHHEFKPTLPDAEVLVHPRLPGGTYPFGGLSGSGVALKVAWALCKLASGPAAADGKVTPVFREFLLEAVGLAAMGTIADVVPLHDENRILVRHGLKRLSEAPSAGLAAMLANLKSSGSKPRTTPELIAEDIGYKLAPQLNAVGRLGCARLAVDLLTTATEAKAKDLAAQLESYNEQRKTVEHRMQRQARKIVEEQFDFDGDLPAALVLASQEWHPGVMGIVAGRIAELYARPVLMIAEPTQAGEFVAAGSGRSVPGFPLHLALAACSDGLISHGGHAAAAGFKLPVDLIPRFREAFVRHAAAHFCDGIPAPELLIDAEIPLSAVTVGLVNDLSRLEPYGAQNPRPRFLVGGVRVAGAPKVVPEGGRHLSFQVRQDGAGCKAIAWGMADRQDELMSAGGVCSLVFSPKINDWNGRTTVDLEVVDFQAGPQARLC